MSGRGPQGPRGGGRGNPLRGRGDGGLAPQGRGRGDGASPRGDGRGGRGDGRGAPRGGSSFRKLGDDEHTPGPKIFSPSGENSTPDAEVEAKENQIVKENKGLSLSTLSLADFKLPLRPGYGVEGTVVHLRTNYFKMTINAGKKLFKYTITLTAKHKEPIKDKKTGKVKLPAIPPERSRKRRQALALLFQQPDFRSTGHGVATDYGSIIITSKELPLREDETKEYTVVYLEIEDREPASNPIIYTFKLSYGGLIPTTELLRYLASTPTDPSDFTGKDDAIQALNIIVARTPNFNPGVFQSGNNKFFHYPVDPNTYDSLGGGLIAVRGYYSSVRTSTLRTLLNVNAQTSPFYPAINVLDLITQHGRGSWPVVENFLRLLRVKTKYMKHKDGTEAVKVKTILSLSQKWVDVLDKKGNVVTDDKGKVKQFRDYQTPPYNAEQVSFECKELGNKTFTIAEYFKAKYNITLVTPQAWLLNCGTREKPTWIPPELCEVMPGQAFRGKLSDHQTAQMILVAARGPGENARRIANGAHRVIGFQGNNPSLTAFGVGVDSKMLVIKGRILPAPPVTYGSKSQITPTEASWNMRGKKFAKSVKLMKWSFLKLGGARLETSQLDMFKRALKDYGIESDGPSNPRGFEAALPGAENTNDSSIQNIFRTMFTLGIKMVLVILPSTSAATYARVKYWGDVKAGIHSVCVHAEKLNKGAQYYANVALKFNLKNGGVNQLLPNQLGFLNNGQTMVVGIDVTHPAPKSMEGTPSIAAVVASVDNDYGQWPGSIRCQETKKEMVSTLNFMMQERLRLWVSKNNRGPAKILIYRDGVSEGQYKTVLEDELTQIREACKEIYGQRPLPQITIVVVGKRHHTRFYPTDTRTADRNGNPLNGTVVDRGVTMEKGFDFFLQAHTALQGTAKPSHYVVILDEMKLGAEELQTITHHLCYGFGRATKAVSICPPAYYADILCERGRCYLAQYVNGSPPGKVFDWQEAPWTGNVHENLSDSMFYI